MAKTEHPKISTKKHLARVEREQLQKRIIFITLGAIILLVFGVIGYGILDLYVLQPLQPVAIVGDVTISGKEFQVQAQIERLNLVQQYQYYNLVGQATSDINLMIQAYTNMQTIQNRLSSDTTFGQNFLNQMIDDVIIAQQAPSLGISISQDDIDQIVFSSQGFYPGGTPTPENTPTTFSTPTVSNAQLTLLGPTLTPTLTPTATLDPAATSVEPTDSSFTSTTTLESQGVGLSIGSSPTSGVMETTATPVQIPSETAIIPETPTITPTLSFTLAPTASPTIYSTELFAGNLATFLDQLNTYGISESDWRTYIESQLLRQRVFDYVTADVPTSAEQVWVRHILVATEDEARAVIQRYDEGESWYALANELSLDTSNNSRGGDLGWFPRGAMVTAFENVAFSLPVGSISQPVQTDFGWHVIQIIGHEDNMPLSPRYYQIAQQAAFDNWLQQFKVGMDIQTLDSWRDWVPTQPTLDTTN